MSEQVEIYKAIKKHNKEEKEYYIETQMKADIEALRSASDVIESHSEYHIAIFKKGRVFEYWPTTQKWWDRKNNKRSHGVDRLLKELEV